jgi:peroxiredoxin
MKFIKEWSEWNPVLKKKALDFIEINKVNLKDLWDDDISEEENIQFLVDYFTEYPDEMNFPINIDNIKTVISKAGMKNSAPILMNIGSVTDFRSF